MPLASDLGQTERLTTIVHPRSGALMIKYEQPLHNTVLISIIYVQVFFPIRHAKKKCRLQLGFWSNGFLSFWQLQNLNVSKWPFKNIHSPINYWSLHRNSFFNNWFCISFNINMFQLLAIWNIISWAINLPIIDTIGCVCVCVWPNISHHSLASVIANKAFINILFYKNCFF